jgi:hypothetical protein
MIGLDLSGSGLSPVVGFYEHNNDSVGSTGVWEISSVTVILKKGSLLWS